jgi:predicted DNA-binding protein
MSRKRSLCLNLPLEEAERLAEYAARRRWTKTTAIRATLEAAFEADERERDRREGIERAA